MDFNTMFYFNIYFIEKKYSEEISPHLRDKQIECFTFKIIKQLRTMIQTKAICFIEAEKKTFDKTLRCSLARPINPNQSGKD